MKKLLSAIIIFFAVIAGVFVFNKPASAGQDSILTSAARTATATSSDIVKTTQRGAHFIINVTAVPGVDTITPKIQGKDYNGTYYDLLVGTAISTTGTTVLKIYPGIGIIANGSAADVLPDVYRVVVTHSGAGSFTYSVTQNTAN